MTHTTESLMELAYDYSKSCMTFVEPKALAALYSAITELVAERDALRGREPVWYEGEPPFPQNQEWFIAKTIHGDKVVLTALPKEYTYDYKTADETYMLAKNIAQWMQFPDCEYLPPAAPVAPTQPDELQSGDELPEPDAFVTDADVRDFGKGIGESAFLFAKYKEWNVPLYSQGKLHQAQAMARSKLLDELGDVEAVAVVKNHNLQPDDSDMNQVHAGNALVSYQTINFALPAQDVNAELVEALELALVYWKDRQQRYKNRAPVWVESARTALANAKAAQQKGQS